jgi:hypothetical protein
MSTMALMNAWNKLITIAHESVMLGYGLYPMNNGMTADDHWIRIIKMLIDDLLKLTFMHVDTYDEVCRTCHFKTAT